MSKDFPTLEENIQFIIKDLGLERLLKHTRPEEVVQAIPGEQKEALLRILLKQLGTERVESILRNDGKLKP